MTNASNIPMSRRTVLAGASVAGFAAVTPVSASLLPDPEKTEDYDVVVIGSGMAGCAAALEAAGSGARVVVLEKLAENRMGGNSALAGGLFAAPLSASDADKSAFVADFEGKALGRGNSELYRLMAQNITGDLAWLSENGVPFNPPVPSPTYKVQTATVSPGAYMGMPRMLQGLRDRITEAGGSFRFETKAQQLIMNDRAAVSGVRAVGPDGVVDFNAGAVVIAAGGYAGNTQVMEAYSDPNAGALMVRGVTSATGDGLLMGQSAGAGLKGMGGVMALHIAAVDTVETAAGNPFMILPYCLSVNRNGARFIDESKGYVAHGKAVLSQPQQQASLVFDGTIAALPAGEGTLGTFRRLGINIIEAASIEELAESINVPVDALVQTVTDFNAAVQGDKTEGIEPGKAALAHRIEGPTYYAIHPLAPGVTLTFGGLMINGNSEVLEADGRVIRGLYAAGEGAGAPFFDDYVGGASLTNCLVMGRIAGRSAIS